MKVFIDSNVPLYAVNKRAQAKHDTAKVWMERLGAREAGGVSWQVLHEFYSNATKKIGLDAASAREFAEELLLWDPIGPSIGLVRRAWEWCETAHVAYWDALIVAAAEVSGARYLLTEDLQAGRAFGGVRVVNPFGDEGEALLKTLS